MRKILAVIAVCVLAVTASAVPARRGWQTRIQADGTTVEVQQFGDEYYHFMVNRAGKEVREIDGMYVEVGDAPTEETAQARRAKGVARRQRQEVGSEPNLAPKGVVIVANFNDQTMLSDHTHAVFDELFNSTNCTVNSGYPSAGQYFADQSNGTYRPQFDVFGPVNLSRNMSYYGTDNPGRDEGDDQHATDAVVEACRIANEQYTINWADYDSNNDGYVDFVYVVYAGYGQADGGASNTIWPHNWEIESAIAYGYCTYTKAQCVVGGKKLNSYAMSSELDHYADALNGIGTLCHEFGHVMGMPDWYDTNYGTNYDQCLTPGDWDVMDGGAYGGDGHCPPNYSPWEKYFFGWHTPINLGSTPASLTLHANGTDHYQAYQINASGTQQSPTTSGWCYYIENRQKVGWDAPLSGHGMLIWKVNFNASKWESNEPNNTANNPLYTIVSATGTKIGWDGSTDHSPKNPFPGTGNKTSWTGLTGKPLLNIAESRQVITLDYIEASVVPSDPFDVVFMSNGVAFDTVTSTGTLVLPATEPDACEGKVFVGWTATADYSSATTAPVFVQAGDAVAEGAVFYAVFAEQSGEGGASQTTTYTFTSKAWADATNSWTSLQDGYAIQTDKGVQVTANVSGASAETKTAMSNVSQIVVSYCTNATKGAGSIKMSVGTTELSQEVTKTGGVALRNLEYNFNNASGKVGIEVTCTTNSIYVYSVAVTADAGASYSNYSTSCSGGQGTSVESVGIGQPAARKVIRNGELVIIRGEEIYSITGLRLE